MSKKTTGMIPKTIKFPPDEWADLEKIALKQYGEPNHIAALIRSILREEIMRRQAATRAAAERKARAKRV